MTWAYIHTLKSIVDLYSKGALNSLVDLRAPKKGVNFNYK